MSYLTGALSGALVAGGVYYGFANLIRTRSETHVKDIRSLSERLRAPPSATVPAPIPASDRIVHHEFNSVVRGRWNEEIAAMIRSAERWDRRLAEWGRNFFYGGTDTA